MGAFRKSKEVRDPNFSNQSLGRSMFSRKEEQPSFQQEELAVSMTNLQQRHLEALKPSSETQQVAFGNYQTQQLQHMNSDQFGQTQVLPDRLSQIMQR